MRAVPEGAGRTGAPPVKRLAQMRIARTRFVPRRSESCAMSTPRNSASICRIRLRVSLVRGPLRCPVCGHSRIRNRRDVRARILRSRAFPAVRDLNRIRPGVVTARASEPLAGMGAVIRSWRPRSRPLRGSTARRDADSPASADARVNEKAHRSSTAATFRHPARRGRLTRRQWRARCGRLQGPRVVLP